MTAVAVCFGGILPCPLTKTPNLEAQQLLLPLVNTREGATPQETWAVTISFPPSIFLITFALVGCFQTALTVGT